MWRLEQAQLKTGGHEQTPKGTGLLCAHTTREAPWEEACRDLRRKCGNGCELKQHLPSCASPGQAICVTSFPKRRRTSCDKGLLVLCCCSKPLPTAASPALPSSRSRTVPLHAWHGSFGTWILPASWLGCHRVVSSSSDKTDLCLSSVSLWPWYLRF